MEDGWSGGFYREWREDRAVFEDVGWKSGMGLLLRRVSVWGADHMY